MKNDYTDDWRLLETGKEYKNTINLYKNVDQNEAFYAGEQWRGVQAADLMKPVFNIFKRVINYFISSILSQKIKMQFSIENIADDTEDIQEQELIKAADILSKHSQLKWEKLKMDYLLRCGLLDAALSGDLVAYTYWDDSIETGQSYGENPKLDVNGQPIYDELGNVVTEKVKIKGDYVTELIDNVNVFPGNPNSSNIQKQPYIIILGRDLVSELKKEAKANGVTDEDIKKIEADTDTDYQSGDRGKIELDYKSDSGKCNYVIKLWKDDKTGNIMMRKSTKYIVIKELDTELKMYPVAIMNWDKRKNSFHGQAIGTGLIPNQIYINKQFALVMKHMIDMAFGKVAYDGTVIQQWSNKVGEAIPVQGKPQDAVYPLPVAQMNSLVLEVIDKTINLTKDLIGASDAALGNIDPKNTSAIIAVQQASSMPLESVKENLYQFVEDIGLIWLDFMIHKYKVPRNIAYENKGVKQIATFNPEQYKDVLFNIKTDVGPSAYWSEITSMQTLDNLLKGGYLTFIDYLERVPNGIIPRKQELIDNLRQQMQQQINQQIPQQVEQQQIPQQQIM